MKSMNELNDKKETTAFDKKVLSALQFLHPYVKHRLYVAECKGVLPKNLYSSTGIIDDAIIEIYEKGDQEASTETIKLKLFNKVDAHLKEVFAKEKAHSKDENTDTYLKSELESLEVQYFVDAGNETVLYRDLEDISYHQDADYDDYDDFTDESANKHVLSCLDVHSELYHSESAAVGKFYNWLPSQVSNIIDLQMFGKLSAEEIANLKKLDLDKVSKLLDSVPQKFQEHLHN